MECYRNITSSPISGRPGTAIPLKKQLPTISKHLFNRTTLYSNYTRKNKADDYTKAEPACRRQVRKRRSLDWLDIALLDFYFIIIF